MSELDKETQERIEDPVSEQAEEETRLTPAEAVAQMRIKVPTRANRKLATLVDLSVDVRVTPRVGVSLYGARASAGEVVRGVYPGTGPAWLGYLELEVRR